MVPRLHIRLLSVAVMVMYMFTVIGFDVHMSSESGRAYLEPLFAGISCEDIHPDYPCHHCDGHCCGGHDCDGGEDSCLEDEDCCSDNIGVLTLTGTDHQSDDFHAPAVTAVAVMAPSQVLSRPDFSRLPGAFRAPPRSALSRFCILRV